MDENWSQKPLIFRIGAGGLGLKSWRPISARVAKNVLTLADYIFRMGEDRYLTLGADEESQQLFIPRTVPQGLLRNLEACITSAILDVGMAHQGSIIFRHGDDRQRKYIVEGVFCNNGDFFALPAESIKSAHELMPHGTIEADPTATYRMPQVIFQPPKA